MGELAGDFAKKGVQVVGVSMEEVEALTASNEGRKIELLSDKDGEISEYFGAELKLPSSGPSWASPPARPSSSPTRARSSTSGARARTWRTSSRAHAEQVLEAIDEKV